MLTVDNISEWVRNNNLTLNRPKSAEIVFTDDKKRRSFELPQPLPDTVRVQSLITISSTLSLTEHVNNVISSCASSLYATKVLRAHGLCDTALQEVYKQSSGNYCTRPPSAWWGFASAADRCRDTGSKWKQSFAAASVLACTVYGKLLAKSSKVLMTNYLIKSYGGIITFYMNC